MVLDATRELIVLEFPHEVEIDVGGVRRKYLLARLRKVLCVSLLVHESIIAILVLLLLLLQKLLLNCHLDLMKSEAFGVRALITRWPDKLSLRIVEVVHVVSEVRVDVPEELRVCNRNAKIVVKLAMHLDMVLWPNHGLVVRLRVLSEQNVHIFGFPEGDGRVPVDLLSN